jgi:amidohydrolase
MVNNIFTNRFIQNFKKFIKMKKQFTISVLLLLSGLLAGQKASLNDRIVKLAAEETGQYNNIYTGLHKNPELSLMEFNTSKKMAEELKSIGFEVTAGVGGNGVIGIFKNGPGKVVMLRTDMDALPVKENTGLPFSSTVIMKDINGNENPVMHACGHDLHMTTWLGILRALVTLKSEWKGTIMAIAQPGEEGSLGAIAMIRDGLFKKFPVPDFALCYHVSAELPAGTIGYYPGPIFAGVKSASITVYGSGGHGAMPHTTIDPIVIAARIILDIQTIVSRKINPVKPAVVTVGAIHGGTKNNIIPDEVKMLLTIRFFEDDVFKTIRQSLIDITRGAAISAGLPESKMPLVEFDDSENPPVSNNPGLVMTSVKSMKNILGENNVFQVDPATVAEDFGKYGLTEEKIPVAIFWLGGVNRNKYDKHISEGTALAPLHNSSFAPDFDPAFSTGVAAMTRTVIDLFGNNAVKK